METQVKTSSVIALATWKEENGRKRCIITEILKQNPNTTFNYKVGDEYPRGNLGNRPGTDFGDGQVLFYSGSPARLVYAATYSDDRIIGLGGMSLTAFREVIENLNR